MRSFSERFLVKNRFILPLIIYFTALFSRTMLSPLLKPVYDETAYSATAYRIATTGKWLNIYGSDDLFFFPPLFNWVSAFFIIAGFERLDAVRTVTILLSSGIPVLLYLLMKKNGAGTRIPVKTALIWLLFPGVTHFSIIGQVETPFLFFVLLSLLMFLQRKNSDKYLILSALFLAAAVWTKETAFGFSGVFFLMMISVKEYRSFLKWGAAFTLFISPLVIQSFVPHNYDIFYELSNDHITWGSVSFIKPFLNTAVLIGARNLSKTFSIVVYLFISAAAVYSCIFCLIKYRKTELVKFSLFSLAVFIPFFAVFPKKFDYYLIPVLLFFLICFATTMLKNKYVAVISVIFIATIGVYGLQDIKRGLDGSHNASLKIIQRLAKENLRENNRVVSPTPEILRYIAEKQGVNADFSGIDFTSPAGRKNCMTAKDRCILDYDYYITDEMFFEIVFCSTWPIKIENCDIEAMRFVIGNTELLEASGGIRLYKIKK